MITLYQFAPVWGIPNLGAFCAKTETVMRIAGVPYEVKHTLPPRAPKGKLPYIDDDGVKVADSRFILQHLRTTHGVDLDRNLDATQKAVSIAFQRLLEDDLYWVMVYFRFIDAENWPKNKRAILWVLPPVIRDVVGMVVRKTFRKEIWGQGLGRHREEEILQIGCESLDALSSFLGDKAYFFGDEPTTLDASAFGQLVNIVNCPLESGLKEHAMTKQNLVDFVQRMQAAFFSDKA